MSTATHQGLCAACGATFTVDPAQGQRLAKHGYQRRWGEHRERGRCTGAYRLPHELSPDVARECRGLVTVALTGHTLYLGRLQGGEVTSLHEEQWDVKLAKLVFVELTPADGPRFVRALRRTVLQVQGYVASCKAELRRLDALLLDWAPRALTPLARREPMGRCVRCRRARPTRELRRRQGFSRTYVCPEGCEPPLAAAPAAAGKDPS